MSPDEKTSVSPEVVEQNLYSFVEGVIDWGDDADEVILPSCDLENPESCESCQ
jgi:hypothetical protein